MAQSKRIRLLELDVFRGLAALVVVLYHFTTRYEEIYGHPSELLINFSLGHFGVNFFFMISGFVIFLTLNSTKSHWDFIVSRFSRLYPVYWAAVTVTFACMLIFGLEGLERTPTEYLLNLSMVSGFFDVRDIDGVYWTLRYELLFYFWMLVLFKIRLLKHMEIVGALWVLLALAFHTLPVDDFLPLSNAIHKYFILQYIHLFVSGIIFFNILSYGTDLKRLVILGLCLAAQFFSGELTGFIITTSFFILFYLFTQNLLKFIALKPLIFFGTISYSLYLIHENIGFIVLQELYPLGAPPFLAISAACIISIAISTALTFFIEKPSLAWIRVRYKNFKNRKHA